MREEKVEIEIPCELAEKIREAGFNVEEFIVDSAKIKLTEIKMRGKAEKVKTSSF